MPHSLVEIPRPQWEKLRDLYLVQKCRASAYNLLQCLIEWADQQAEVKIYSLDGQWEEDGTFVATHFKPITYVYCNTLSEDQERLRTALQLLKPKGLYLIFGFPDRILKTVEQHHLDRGLAKEKFKPDGTFWYHIEKEKAEQFSVDVPEGLSLRRLEPKHAEQVNNNWPHRAPGSVHFVTNMITYNESVGVFDTADNLVAWVLRLPIGSLGLLQVMETHKRRGLGSLVVRYMSKLLASKNLEVTAPVVFQNVASRSMFDKLGFKVIDYVWWAMMPERED